MSQPIKLAIKNYQIISDARLEFDEGLTLIVGSSNNGKSAVIRAIEALIYNKAGNSFIKLGEPATVVGVSMNGHTVLWKKTSESGEYKIDGQVYNKIGRGQLVEVADALKISEISVNQDKVRVNFLKQMEYPFLLDKNPSQLFEFLSMSSDTDRLSDIFKTMRSDLKQTETDINIAIGKVDGLKLIITNNKNTLDNYKDVDVVANNILSYDSRFNKYADMLNVYNSLCSMRETLLEKKPNLDSLRARVSSLEELFDKIDTSVKVVEPALLAFTTLTSSLSSLRAKREVILSSRKDIDSMSSNLSKIDIPLLQAKESNVKSLTSSVNSLCNSLQGLSKLDTEISSLKDSLSVVLKDLSSYKACPLCGSPLSEDRCSVKEA